MEKVCGLNVHKDIGKFFKSDWYWRNIILMCQEK